MDSGLIEGVLLGFTSGILLSEITSLEALELLGVLLEELGV